MKIKNKLFFYLFVVVLIVFLDQFFKKLMLSQIGLNNTGPFIPGIIRFSVVKNTGGAFSIFKQYPVFFQLVGIVNVFIFSYLTFCPTRPFNSLMKVGCDFILGGTVGNLIDRFLRGGVIDFLDFQFVNFAIFNLADVFIDIGVVLILIGWFLCRGNPVCLPKNNE